MPAPVSAVNRRDVVVAVRLTAREAAALDVMRRGLSRGEFIRGMLLAGQKRPSTAPRT